MLLRLEISNLAVIEHCVFEPSSGLNVLTGETGAGKSLLIDALGLVLGDKASRNLVRTGCDKARIEAVFDLSDLEEDIRSSIRLTLEDNGLAFDEYDLIIDREINSDGRSLARINGKTCILSVLSSIASLLLDIHGQNDTQKIFNENTHCDLLDRFIGREAFDRLKAYRKELETYKDIVLKIKELGQSPEILKKRREMLEFAVEEITKADFKPGEEEILHADKKRLGDSAKICSLLEEADDLLYASESSASSVLARSTPLLNKLAALDPSYEELAQRLESLALETEALASEIDSRFSSDEYSDAKLDEVDKRLSLLYDLKSKYGDSIESINEYAKRASEEIRSINSSGEELKVLKARRIESEKSLLKAGRDLSAIRHERAGDLEDRIVRELKDLEMPNTRFKVEFSEHPKDRYFSSLGTESIRFLLSANSGEDPKPLSKIASGGEASRIMLAVKTILSEADSTPVLVFDEIDTGISGVAASMVAQKLKRIGKDHQVLCVTHTAQPAAAADENFFISKTASNDSTSTVIEHLDEELKIREVSRLLSGTTDNDSLKLAQSLVEKFY